MDTETLNISPEAPQVVDRLEHLAPPKAAKVKHTHKPNFGRLVDGCEACALRAVTPAANAARPPRPRIAPNASQQSTSAPESASSAASLERIAQLMMLEHEERLLKKEDDKRRLLESKTQMRAEVQAIMARQSAEQGACSRNNHQKENGKSAVVQGQVYNDGYVRPFCQRCLQQFGSRRPSVDQMQAHING